MTCQERAQFMTTPEGAAVKEPYEVHMKSHP